MPRIIKYLVLLVIIILGILLNSGCSTILFGPSGSIEITTNPSGVKIFLDGKDTGRITPYTLKSVSAGNHIIEVTLSDMKCTKIAKVKAYQTTSIHIEFYPQITLAKINVLPSITNITLSLGSTVTISSVTAYYSDYSSANIPLTNCTYSSNDACATVNSSGTITGISAGAAIITVSYTEGGITKTDTVLVYVRNTPTDIPIVPPVTTPVIYRAFCVGVGDYLDTGVTDLEAPEHNVNRIIQVFNSCKFGSEEIVFSTIEPLKDENATKTAIINGIASTFSGADDNDVSYFYFAGHGSWDFITSYICPTDANGSIDSFISVDELESALSAISGTKVVILDSCNSGGFIGKGKEKITISKEDLASFNDNIINIFSQSQSKGLLTTNQYKVLTASHYDQSSYGDADPHPIDGYPCSFFNRYLCLGCGYDDGTLHADWIDVNTKVSLQELYLYIKIGIEIDPSGVGAFQDTQVFPEDSDFTVVEY